MLTDLEKLKRKRKNSKEWYSKNKELSRQRARNYYHKNAEENKKKHKKYLETKPKTYSVWILIKSRAKKLGLPFDLKLEDIPEKTICPVFKTTISFGLPKNTNPLFVASVDRLIPSKGYTKDNTRFISFRANQIKNDASIEDIENILKYMKENIED